MLDIRKKIIVTFLNFYFSSLSEHYNNILPHKSMAEIRTQIKMPFKLLQLQFSYQNIFMSFKCIYEFYALWLKAEFRLEMIYAIITDKCL